MAEAKQKITEHAGQTLAIPARIRSFVYLIGMLGFPVVVAAYVLVVLSTDLKGVEKTLNQLATRIDERPMGLDKTTDVIIYMTDSMRHELMAGLNDVTEELDFTTRPDTENIRRTLTIIKRQISGFVRPIVRRHKRFAARFPSEGGNLGSYFTLSAAAENIEAGATEGYLTGTLSKDFGESLGALLINILSQFGDERMTKNISQFGSEEAEFLKRLFGAEPPNEKRGTPTDTVLSEPTRSIDTDQTFEIIGKELFLKLAEQSINTGVTGLRDQMLTKIRVQSSETKG